MYDARTARFLQEDTYSGDPNDPLSLNLYTYCENEPLMYWDPSGHFEETDKMILDSTTLGLLEIYGDNWNAYNQKANSYKNKDKDLYDFYIGLRNDQHSKAEEARADYVANYLENDYIQEKVLDYVEAKSGKQAAAAIASTYYSYNNDGKTTQAIYQQMHIKSTGIVTANEKLLINAQNTARSNLDDILDQKNQYGYTYYSMSFGKIYQDKAASTDTNNFVWQKFAFVAGLYIDVNNPAGRVEPEAFASNAGKIIVDYSSRVVSGMLISDGAEPGGRDFLNIIDPFKHEKKANKAGIKADYVNGTEYKYLIYGNQENPVRKKYIGYVEDYKKDVEKSNFKYGNEKQSRIYKKLMLEYINNVINENKNRDATVKKLNNEFAKIFK